MVNRRNEVEGPPDLLSKAHFETEIAVNHEDACNEYEELRITGAIPMKYLKNHHYQFLRALESLIKDVREEEAVSHG